MALNVVHHSRTGVIPRCRGGKGAGSGGLVDPGSIAGMRLTEFYRLVGDEFGEAEGKWILHSHVLGGRGKTAEELMSEGENLRRVWQGLCADFDVPEERQLGRDD